MHQDQTEQDKVRDPYEILGLSKSADQATIKKAYRKLAKENHPDRHQGDSGAQARFAEINSAYEILGDKDKRGQYDRGEIDAEGKPRFHGFEGFAGGQGFENIDPSMFAEAFGKGFGRSGGGARTFRFSTGGGPQSGSGGAEDILSSIFGGGAPGGGFSGGAKASRKKPRKGSDIKASVAVTLEDIAAGKKPSVRLPSGKTIAMTLPKGVEAGQVVRLKGQGGASASGGPTGDALVTVKLVPHPLFVADKSDLRLDMPVGLHEAVLGAKIAVPTLTGKVQIAIPPNTSGGKVLRLKGKGLPAAKGHGDLLVRVSIKLPDKADKELRALMKSWRDQGGHKPRGAAFE